MSGWLFFFINYNRSSVSFVVRHVVWEESQYHPCWCLLGTNITCVLQFAKQLQVSVCCWCEFPSWSWTRNVTSSQLRGSIGYRDSPDLQLWVWIVSLTVSRSHGGDKGTPHDSETLWIRWRSRLQHRRTQQLLLMMEKCLPYYLFKKKKRRHYDCL